MARNKISQRKIDHLRIATSEVSQTGDNGFSKYRFVHNALPEINFDEIDLSTTFLNKKVNYPFFISCMTGGVAEGLKINRNLAGAAQKYGIAMGVGSQRAAVEHPELAKLFMAREVAPDIPLIANVGLVQLNYGFTYKEFQKCVDMIEADALAVHINPIQEVIQPEGDRNFKGLLPKLTKLIDKVLVPIIAKEVGFGVSYDVARRLYRAGIRIIDTAGWGGTSWAVVEGNRRDGYKELGDLFGTWGIPSAESITQVSKLAKQKRDLTVLGSGGVRDGIEIAKALALGADLVGIAMPFAKAALVSQEAVEKLIERLAMELKVAMFGVGAKNISELKKAQGFLSLSA
ncbi:type 2 isopentenyl-diphosphate Delta-isomerase [Candidatus Woesebacteria bacterium RIFCSPHIGHO2_01_FULL_44_21]|uniref:Isopentenyl-diphosphate delta-isomerase n=1 Tax=Candidatus Woesebacteria bacterium RIFCSPHIGHO2_01_FULL_44_21 TaxID=1802503 RepID=A0A1F7YXL9_9BACT|nr:MAG: type 2 isopentenyl-diphosphate Delta-isomerase [Candidatus Woesebacteria bacterium RIFCSPHIGHO2_01_FULL_44_21]OGM70392.1 MAG: type 2 isopentenyl-diphosphate Delta-isomerase [Candidatus Woesebacteria bacterium RIFCSPLOWO2_01_FULL_44_24b]